MTIARPVWLEYAIYEDVGGYPILVGFKKGTPKEIIKAYKDDVKASQKAREEGILL